LADGRRRLSEIIRILHGDPNVSRPSTSYTDVAVQLQQGGLLFRTMGEYQASTTDVYNRCEPTGLHLEITNACNMTCTHCYVSSGKKLSNEMSLAEVFRAIDMLPPFSGKRVAISGGEPAVRKDCAKILEYCVLECGHEVDLYTNGLRFPRTLAERILELNEIATTRIRVQVSLEGASAETNDRVRGSGSFEETLTTLRMFQELGLQRSTVIFVCVTKYNIHEIDDLIGLAESYDVERLVFSQWQRQGNASNMPWATISPSPQEWVALGEKLLRYRHPRLTVSGNFYGDLRNDVATSKFSLDSPLFPKHLYFYNAFPRITPQGHIFADQLWVDPTWILGNIRTDTLVDCFETPKFADQLQQMRRRQETVEECQSCEWLNLCQGGSPGHTYAEYGHMNRKDLFCDSRIYWFNRYVEHQVKALVAPGAIDTPSRKDSTQASTVAG
jgi:radical SAM protein with 4Fe4S-binding SPASM domain